MKNILSLLLKLYNFNFFRRIVPSVIRKLYKNKKQIVKINNFNIILNVGSSIDREIFLKKIYNKEQFEYFENKINLFNFDYFIDVGAYIGYYSLYISSKYKNIKVITFEPIKESFNQIHDSKLLNNLNNIDLYNFGLSHINGTSKSWVTDLNKKSGFSLFNKDDLNNEIKSNNYNFDKLKFQNIKIKTFDSNFEISNRKIFIKIDVERHEYEVILGAKNFFKHSNNLIFLQIEIVSHLEKKVLDLLKSYNFKIINRIYPDDIRGGSDFYLSNYDV